MNPFKHLAAFDLTSYGCALQIINQFADDEGVKVFEVSPCGGAAALLLISRELHALTLIQASAGKLFKNQVAASEVIADMHPDLLPVYLSQKTSVMQEELAIYEGAQLSKALAFADRNLKSGLALADFRVLRTSPLHVIMTFTGRGLGSLAGSCPPDFKISIIENVQMPLKSFFEIVN